MKIRLTFVCLLSLSCNWLQCQNDTSEFPKFRERIRKQDAYLKSNPGDAITFVQRGDNKMQLKYFAAAIEDHKIAVALQPVSKDGFDNRAYAYSHLAKCEIELGMLNHAYADYAEALRLIKDEAKYSKSEVALYFSQLAYIRCVQGNLQSGLKLYDSALVYSPKDPVLYFNKARTQFGLNDFDAAVETNSKAISLSPKYAEAYVNRGTARGSLGDFSGALMDFNRALDLGADPYTVLINRGPTKFNLGDQKGAFADLNQAIEISPNRYEAYRYRGLLYQHIDKYAESQQDLKRVEEIQKGIK